MSNTPPLHPPLDSIEVRDSEVHGRGAFATRGLPRGHCVGVYEGRRYGPGEDEDKEWNNGLTYLFALSDGSMIDATDGGNATRHINHSCAPNCEAYEVTDEDGEVTVAIHTKRRLRAGEELFLDYQLDVGEDDPGEYPCHCGSARCRGTLAARGGT